MAKNFELWTWFRPKIKIVNKSKKNPNPSYETSDSAGMDIRSNQKVTIKTGTSETIKTGLYIQLPSGYEAQIRSRSGLASKNGIIVLNSPGTIDADYRGEIKIILANLSSANFDVKKGDRIAQMVISQYEQAWFEDVKSLDDTDRGSGGFGSTGIE
jgi:dUTP pyrophosphatase|tara:strand:- start:993 stop:1460 length:468 start_codon:yes stop_codon:yes gene_type:complete